MKTVRGLMTGGAAMLLALLATPCCRGGEALALVLAQERGMTVTESGKNYIVEILVTVALFGLALWVVCKSSRRV